MLKIYTLAKIYTFESNFDYLCLYYLTEVYRFVRGTKNTKSEKRITKSKKKKKRIHSLHTDNKVASRDLLLYLGSNLAGATFTVSTYYILFSSGTLFGNRE